MNGFPVISQEQLFLPPFSLFFSSHNINFKAYKELLEVKVESENVI